MTSQTDPTDAGEQLTARVWRGCGGDGRLHEYRLPTRKNQTVLDVVTEIQRRLEPSLAYRFACRVGVCGSCAMTVNGAPRWTCRTHVNRVAADGVLTIEPLRGLPVIKDLACDMTGFFDKWREAGGVFQGTATRHEPVAPIRPASAKRRAADAAIECINCAVCYSACDVAAWRPDYLGPAALNRAWSVVNDERAANAEDTLKRATGAGGCGGCHFHGACMRHCPMELSPSASIAGLKRRSLLDFFMPESAEPENVTPEDAS